MIKGSVYTYAENPISKHSDRYVIRRTKPRMFLRIMEDESEGESIGHVMNRGIKEYLIIDQIIDTDATESSLRHAYKRAIAWYIAYLKNLRNNHELP